VLLLLVLLPLTLLLPWTVMLVPVLGLTEARSAPPPSGCSGCSPLGTLLFPDQADVQ
jgi:hypothetical protein